MKKSGRYQWNENRSEMLHVNEAHVKNLINQMDILLAEIMADANPFRDGNGRIKNVIPEDVEKYNKYLGMYQEICNSELEFAKEQDEVFNGLLLRFARMEKKEDEIIAMLENRNRHAN